MKKEGIKYNGEKYKRKENKTKNINIKYIGKNIKLKLKYYVIKAKTKYIGKNL